MSSNISVEMQDLVDDLNSPLDSVRLNAAKQLGRSEYAAVEIIEALENTRRNDKNKFIRFAAKMAVNKLNAITEITGTNRPISELPDRDLLERLIKLQLENNKLLSAYNRQLSWQTSWLVVILAAIYFLGK